MAEQMTDDQIIAAMDTRYQALRPKMFGDVQILIEHIQTDIDMLKTLARPTQIDRDHIRFLIALKSRCEHFAAKNKKNSVGGQTDGAKQKTITTKETV